MKAVNPLLVPLILVASVVALPSFLDIAGAPGGESPTAPYNNLVFLDADEPVMAIHGGLAMNGTYGHIFVHNLAGAWLTGSLHLVNPLGNTVATEAVQSSGIAFLYDVDLSLEGTWKLKGDTGATLTQFDVATWDGQPGTPIRDDLVTLFPNTEGFLDDLIIANNGGTATFRPQESSQGELKADSTDNRVFATAQPNDILVGCTQGPTVCPVVVPMFINATSVDINLNIGDSIARLIVVRHDQPYPNPPPAYAMTACATAFFIPTPTGTAYDLLADHNVKCALLLDIGETYHFDIAIAGVFTGPMGIPVTPPPVLADERFTVVKDW